MSSDNVVIRARGLGKIYRIYDSHFNRIRQSFSLGNAKHYREFHALDGVDFEIRRGETIGLVGRNGSGKSTLLQLICGIRKPTSGTITVRGRVSALLELGAGFHPEFTGRENVYMQGAIMGIPRKQMEERFADIEAFADIGDFIDQPVKIYSSGMFLRLAFAVAVHVSPDILVIDEALAVGDARFQSKCFRRLEMLKNQGATILVVSHAAEQIARLCDRALLLDGGRLVASGEPATLVSKYLNLLFDGSLSAGADEPAGQQAQTAVAGFLEPDREQRYHLRPTYNRHEYRWGNNAALLLDYLLASGGGEHVSHIGAGGQPIRIGMKVLFQSDIAQPIYGLTIKSKEGVTLAGTNSRDLGQPWRPARSGDTVFVEFALTPHLSPGDYFVSLGVAEERGEDVVPLDRRYDSIHLRVTGPARHAGIVDMSPEIDITLPA